MNIDYAAILARQELNERFLRAILDLNQAKGIMDIGVVKAYNETVDTLISLQCYIGEEDGDVPDGRGDGDTGREILINFAKHLRDMVDDDDAQWASGVLTLPIGPRPLLGRKDLTNTMIPPKNWNDLL